jgi:hypothetical protein
MPDRKKLLLRLDPRVYDAVARWAADDLRSVNAQIEYALRLALRSAGRDLHRREPDRPEPDRPEPDRPEPDGRAARTSDPDGRPESGGPEE